MSETKHELCAAAFPGEQRALGDELAVEVVGEDTHPCIPAHVRVHDQPKRGRSLREHLADANQLDPATGVALAQPAQRLGSVAAFGQAGSDLGLEEGGCSLLGNAERLELAVGNRVGKAFEDEEGGVAVGRGAGATTTIYRDVRIVISDCEATA
jgi:hypothetical protein